MSLRRSRQVQGGAAVSALVATFPAGGARRACCPCLPFGWWLAGCSGKVGERRTAIPCQPAAHQSHPPATRPMPTPTHTAPMSMPEVNVPPLSFSTVLQGGGWEGGQWRQAAGHTGCAGKGAAQPRTPRTRCHRQHRSRRRCRLAPAQHVERGLCAGGQHPQDEEDDDGEHQAARVAEVWRVWVVGHLQGRGGREGYGRGVAAGVWDRRGPAKPANSTPFCWKPTITGPVAGAARGSKGCVAETGSVDRGVSEHRERPSSVTRAAAAACAAPAWGAGRAGGARGSAWLAAAKKVGWQGRRLQPG